MGRAWKQKELNFLESAYMTGMKEKQIADFLDRTRLSIRKKIDAQGLRQKYKNCRTSENRDSSLPTSNKDLSHHIGEHLPTIEMPIKWLKERGCFVRYSNRMEAEFILNGQYLTAGQILLFCNKERLKFNLKVLVIPGVSET